MHKEYCYKKKLKTAYKPVCDWRRMGGHGMQEIGELILSNFTYRKERHKV